VVLAHRLGSVTIFDTYVDFNLVAGDYSIRVFFTIVCSIRVV